MKKFRDIINLPLMLEGLKDAKVPRRRESVVCSVHQHFYMRLTNYGSYWTLIRVNLENQPVRTRLFRFMSLDALVKFVSSYHFGTSVFKAGLTPHRADEVNHYYYGQSRFIANPYDGISYTATTRDLREHAHEVIAKKLRDAPPSYWKANSGNIVAYVFPWNHDEMRRWGTVQKRLSRKEFLSNRNFPFSVTWGFFSNSITNYHPQKVKDPSLKLQRRRLDPESRFHNI